MDNMDKRVLRRKRLTIAKYITLSPEYVDEFRGANLMTDHMHSAILVGYTEGFIVERKILIFNWGKLMMKAESNNFQRVIKLLELIPSLQDPQTMSKLCVILEREHEWLADELRAEILAERGQLKIDNYIVKESELLVFREFGSSKRLSEREKKDIQNLVALRTQYAKEVWRRRLELVQNELSMLREANAHKDELTVTLTGEIQTFVRVHAPRLRQKGPTELPLLQSTSQMVASTQNDNEDTEEKPLLDQLQAALDSLEDMTSRSLREKDNLQDERARALKILNIEDENAKLDVELERVIQEALAKLREREKEAESTSDRADNLKAELEELRRQSKQELLSKDETMEKLAAHLNAAHARVRNVQDDLERLRNELLAVQQECARYRERAERLERARRLGYIHEKGNPGGAGGAVSESTPRNSSNKGRGKLTATYPPSFPSRAPSRLNSARSVKAK